MATRILLFAFPAALIVSPAMAAPATRLGAVLDGETAVSDEELAGMRGGFFTAGGAQFDFGASIKTMVNGQLALQTSLQWTNAGAVTQQLSGLGQAIQSQVNNQVANNLAQAGIAAPVTGSGAGSSAGASAGSSTGTGGNSAGSATGNATASNVVSGTAIGTTPASSAAGSAAQTANAAQTAPPTASAAAASNVPAASNSSPAAAAPAPVAAASVEVPGAGGSTQVLANLSANQIQNIILNNASGQNITQDTNIIFTIYNFQAWQQQLAERMVSARLASDMLATSGFAAGH
ncbi:MAG TPA: hypothetical protein VFI23_12275 [Rhizomicrobium sp.]|nr:hypothetical protein [Rhizomicrobium sp.]